MTACSRRTASRDRPLPGESLPLHVSTDAGDVRRRGRPRGGRARGGLARGERRGRRPRDARTTRRRNGCGWPAALEIPIGAGLAQRLLLGDPHRRRRARRRLPRRAAGARRTDARRSILVLSTSTWNAYNDWGGPSLYTGGTRVSFERPLARGFLDKPQPHAAQDAARARPRGAVVLRVGGAARPVGVERRLGVGDMGARLRPVGGGRAVTSSTSRSPRTSSSTPRCSTAIGCSCRSATTSTGRGACARRSTPSPTPAGNAAIFSGNTCFWQVRFDDEHRSMTCFKYRADEDPVVGTPDERFVTGPWSDRRIAWPETRTIGLTFTRGGYSRYGLGVPRGSGAYTVWRPEHWAFEGTDLHYGDELGRADSIVAYEVDGVELTTGRRRPAGADRSRRRARRARGPGHRPGAPVEPSTSSRAATPTSPASSRTPRWPCSGRAGATRCIASRTTTPASASSRSRGGGTVFNAGVTDWTCGLAAATPTSPASPATCSTASRRDGVGLSTCDERVRRGVRRDRRRGRAAVPSRRAGVPRHRAARRLGARESVRARLRRRRADARHDVALAEGARPAARPTADRAQRHRRPHEPPAAT